MTKPELEYAVSEIIKKYNAGDITYEQRTTLLQRAADKYKETQADIAGSTTATPVVEKTTTVTPASTTGIIGTPVTVDSNVGITTPAPTYTTPVVEKTTTVVPEATDTNTTATGGVVPLSSSYNGHQITIKKTTDFTGEHVEATVSGPSVNETIVETGTDPVAMQQSVYTKAKNKIDTGVGSNATTPDTSTKGDSVETYTAPNGKNYLVHTTPAYAPTQFWYDGGYGQKRYEDKQQLVNSINTDNAVGSPNDMKGEYYTGGTTSTDQGTSGTGEDGSSVTKTTTATFDSLTDGPEVTVELTGKPDVDKYISNLATYNTDLNNWIKTNLDVNTSDWNTALQNIDDAELKGQINTRIEQLNSGFATAAENMKAAAELESKAQAIYSNENVRQMREQLLQKGLNVQKAGPAVVFKAMKDRARITADIYKIQADFEKTLSQLEGQRTQLEDNIRNAGMEADKWMIDRKNDITKQIQTLRENYQSQVIANTQNYIMKPQLDILSSSWETELGLIAEEKRVEMINANPTMKVMEAAKVFGSDWAYVSSSIINSAANSDFGTLLAKAGESIRSNKMSEQVSLLKTQKEMQESTSSTKKDDDDNDE